MFSQFALHERLLKAVAELKFVEPTPVQAQAIPAALYTAVAQVLAYVYRLKAALRGEGGMPGEQPVPDTHIPPELDPHHTPRKPAAERTSESTAP